MPRILIAESCDRVAAFLDKGLRAHSFTTATVADGDTAAGFALSGEFDLILLDLGFPGPESTIVLRAVARAPRRTPVIILSTRTDTDAVVAGLESGADDYLGKPFRFDELLARIRRRSDPDDAPTAAVLAVDGLSLDRRSRRARIDDRAVDLTAREFGLLEFFLRHRDQVLTRDQILSQVWGQDDAGRSNVLEVAVRGLRDKLGRERITTVRGVGYRCT